MNGTVAGDKVEYSYDGGKTWVTDLKEYKNVTKGSEAIQVKVTNKNYTPSETILSGTVTITPATLTITTPKAEKVYDGNALTAEGSITGFVNGETATFVTTGSQTEVGNSKNTYTLTWDGTAKETNYTVSDSVGTLEVTKQSIVPDPDNSKSYKDVTIDDPSDATYDGKEHKWTPVVTDKDGNELKEGTDYEVSYSKDDFTNVTGEIKVTITGKGNYTGTVDKTYQITPKAVIITTDSKERVFNDQPLTAPGRVDGIVDGETYGFTVTGTQTYVGSSANSYQMTWAKKGENKYTAKKSNYKVEENIGTLTVTDGTPANPTNPTPATPSTPANPAPSTPSAPSAPANQTPARSTNIITRAAEAISDGAERIASDVREVLNNDDEDVPLAKQKLDDHKCCILHFLIMLLATILYGFYTHNMKKRQKKMFEAREELDLELARRGLPTTKEQEQM